MADKDDEVTPFDDSRQVDRDDDGAPPWLEGDAPAPGAGPVGDDPWAEGENDWRDRLVDEPADDDPLVDRDGDDTTDPGDTWNEPPVPGPAPAVAGPAQSDRDDPLPGDSPVDHDDPDEDTLNLLAERELAALGEDRYPLDDGDALDDDDDSSATPGHETPAGAADSDETGLYPPGPVEQDDDRGGASLVDSDDEGPPFVAAPPAGGQRRWPLALLAVAGLALLLLAVGGYGVMTERAALREEIRDLQARLATAGGPRPGAVPEAAALERLADLQGELASLAQENSALRARIGDLKGRLDAAGEDAAGENAAGEGGAATAVGERALPSRAAPEPEPEPEAAPVPEPEAPPAGESPAPATTADGRSWFVNFSSYAELGTARRRAAELSVDAGRVVVQDAVANGRTVYRVRVVGIGSREAADAIARRLAASYQLPPLWVGRE